MRERLTKTAMGLNDSPTTMGEKVKNPEVSKYETGDPSAWAEDPNMKKPWDVENQKGREETGHPKFKQTYASMIREAKELEEKAYRCLKIAKDMIPGAPQDVIEKQATDLMTMSNTSVNATLRRMREFEASIDEARVTQVVEATLDIMSEEKDEEKEEEKKISKIVQATLEVLAEEEEEEKKECKKEEKECKEEEKEEPKKEAKKEEKEEELKKDEVEKFAKILKAALKMIEAEKKEPVEEKKEEPKKEEVKEATKEEPKEESKKEEVKEAAKEEPKKEEPIEELPKEEKKAEQIDISFDDVGDVLACEEDDKILKNLFAVEELEEEKEPKKEEKKEASEKKGIKSLKSITASNKEESEVEKLSKIWKID